MRTVRRRELIFQNAHHAQARAPFCPPKMVLMTTYVSKMSTALMREHHSRSKRAPCAGENPKVLQRSRESAAAAAARTLQISFWTSLMSAPRSRAQRNDFNVHLDSAGDSFGATAQGGPRRTISRVGKRK